MKIGPFEVLGELGRGGMGIVYLVRTPDGNEAALKVLVKADQATLARFERERRLLASLGEREGFVGLLDSGSAPEGAWILMPFVPGGTLRERLAPELGVEETLGLGVQLAEALGAAHEHGIVHRDVKPENVLFTKEGRALLADLGLAKHFDPGASGASQSVALTAHGAFKGTAGYMAPEQLEDAASVGPQADVFALGAVLYECLAGRPAFEGDTVIEVLSKVSSGTVGPIGNSWVPPWLEAVVLRALARDPRERFAHGRSFALALRCIGEAPSIIARPAAERDGHRLVPRVVLGAALWGLVLLLGLTLLAHENQAPGARTPSPPPPKSPVHRAAPEPPSLSPAELMALAQEKERARDWEGGIDLATRAIELDPKLTRAWAIRAAARGGKGDWDGEIADSTKAIELDPTLAAAWAMRGQARGQRGDWDGQIDDSTRAIELDPRLAGAWANRGQARGQKGDSDGESADSTRAIELDPKLAMAWANRGMARGQTGDWDGMIDDSTRAIELDPELLEAWAVRGEARSQKGDLEGAISDYERFLGLAPEDPVAPEIRRRLEDLEAKRRH